MLTTAQAGHRFTYTVIQYTKNISRSHQNLSKMNSDNKSINYTIYKGSASGKVVQSTAQRDSLVGEEVLLRVTHSSLCGTDEHYLKVDMCLGHECAGTVEQLGPDVKSLKVCVARPTPSTQAGISVVFLVHVPPAMPSNK